MLLFGAYGLMHRGAATAHDEIVVSRGQQENLRLQFERVWQRPATAQELQGLVDNWVKEEILYREGINLSLDRDDTVVRRRVGQKLEFILESATPATPSDAELQAWLDAHADEYQILPTYSIRQIYFDPARHPRLDADIASAKRALDAGREVIGDATLLPAGLDAATITDVQRAYGKEFANALESLQVGSWNGPVQSTFGVHLVALTAHEPARPATLTEVRAEVERDFIRARVQQASTDFYDKLRAKYAVRVESADDAAADPAS